MFPLLPQRWNDAEAQAGNIMDVWKVLVRATMQTYAASKLHVDQRQTTRPAARAAGSSFRGAPRWSRRRPASLAPRRSPGDGLSTPRRPFTTLPRNGVSRAMRGIFQQRHAGGGIPRSEDRNCI